MENIYYIEKSDVLNLLKTIPIEQLENLINNLKKNNNKYKSNFYFIKLEILKEENEKIIKSFSPIHRKNSIDMINENLEYLFNLFK